MIYMVPIGNYYIRKVDTHIHIYKYLCVDTYILI